VQKRGHAHAQNSSTTCRENKGGSYLIYNIISVVREYHIIQTDEVCRVGTAPCYPKDATKVVVIYGRVI
jgi:hypothetical protein